MTFKTIFGAAIVLCVAVYLVGHRTSGQLKTEDLNATRQDQATTDDALAQSAVKKLWSADPGERSAAKEKLMQLGPKAIKPVLDLLEDIKKNPGPRFEIGREKEGAEVLARYKRSSQDKETVDEYFSITITKRLKEDCVQILSQLKAPEAVPLLIEELIFGLIWGGGDYLGMPYEAKLLIEIGPDAVPELIECFQNVEHQVISIFNQSEYTEEERDSGIAHLTDVGKARVAYVLGEIGDVRALPSLENFLKAMRKSGAAEASPSYAISYSEEAIKKIKEKSKSGKQAER